MSHERPLHQTEQTYLAATPPPRFNLPYTSHVSSDAYPRSSTLHGITSAFTSPGSHISSAPNTPIKGFTKEQTKAMVKVWSSPAKLVEVCNQAIGAYIDTQPDASKVMDILSSLLEEKVWHTFPAGP